MGQKRKIEVRIGKNEMSIRIECEHGSLYGSWESPSGLDYVAWRYMGNELDNDERFCGAVDFSLIDDVTQGVWISESE